MRSLAAMAIALSFIGSTCRAVTPRTGPGTDWPCGYHARLCQADGICCPDNADCGGTYACPKGQCCTHVEPPPVPTYDMRPYSR